jgi:hypothetical protein
MLYIAELLTKPAKYPASHLTHGCRLNFELSRYQVCSDLIDDASHKDFERTRLELATDLIQRSRDQAL